MWPQPGGMEEEDRTGVGGEVACLPGRCSAEVVGVGVLAYVQVSAREMVVAQTTSHSH